jgi:membrane fusion protein (multidrug efflux system)
LSYCEIRSPIDGLIGKTKAKVGEFVGQSPNPVILNTVSSTGKVRVEFFLTESDYLILARERSKRIAEGKEPIENQEKGNLQLILSDGSIHPIMGSVDFINREVDQETGSLLIQASFDNPDGLLRPGQFGRVRVKMETVDEALLLPQRCFSEMQGLFSVTAVNDENKIENIQVEVGPMYKDYRLIRSGLQVGDRVVLEGIQKVRPGMVVSPIDVQYESQYSEEINK